MKNFSERKAKIHLIGCGRMGGSILSAWIKKGYPLENIFVEEPNPSEWLKKKAGEGLSLNQQSIPDIKYCFLAVKPQSLEKIIPLLKSFSNKSVTFVSMLAGVEIKRIGSHIGPTEAITRIMPNLPAQVFKGITAIIGNEFVKKEELLELTTLLESFGAVIKLSSEDKIDIVTAISGSGPAYIFLMAELMIKEGMKAGLTSEEANVLAKNTILGAGELMISSDLKPDELRENVTSPGGTTQAALLHLMKKRNGLPYILSNAINAAIQRSKQLSKI